MNRTYVIAGVVGIIVIALGAFFFLRPASSSSSATSSSSDYHDNIYLTRSDATKGTYLTDFQQMTLYTYDKDQPGVSNCTRTCANSWPPYTSGAVAQENFPRDVTVVDRSDGTKQFAYKGMPLYYFNQDENPGDTKGDNVNTIWHIVKI